MKFHIPIIAEVDCASITEAREAAYKLLQDNSFNGFYGADGKLKKTPVKLVLADDSIEDRLKRRVVFLHPSDVPSDYDAEAYEKNLIEEDEEG